MTANTYHAIDRTEFETALDAAGDWERVDPSDLRNTRELVYDIDTGHEHYSVRVFSSLHEDDDTARDSGRDAIRTLLWDHTRDAPVDGASRTHRINTWESNFHPKVDDMQSSADEHAAEEDDQLDALREHDFDGGEFRPEGTVYVADVWKNDFDDVRLALDGDTYSAFKQAGVKNDLDWDETHHKFNEHGNKHWHVDAESVAHVHDALADAGFAFLEQDPALDEGEDEDDPAADAIDDASEGDHIVVEYETKTNGTEKTVAGTVTVSNDAHMLFRRDDDEHLMSVHASDERHGLYTSGSHFPFVGEITNVDVESA